jgi:hypothetical protein
MYINGGQSIPDPPDRSTFNEGGGGVQHEEVKKVLRSMVELLVHRSMAQRKFWTPPNHSTFNGWGGGPE